MFPLLPALLGCVLPTGGLSAPGHVVSSAPLGEAHVLDTAPSDTSSTDTAPTDTAPTDSGGAPLPDAGSGNGVQRFLVFGDWGNGTSTQTVVGEAMADVCAASGCDFAVLVGDNFYPSGVVDTADPYWTDRFTDIYAMDMPYYAVLGNHDWGGSGGGYDETVAQAQIDYTAVSDRWVMPDFTWTQDLGGIVSLVGLDTTTIFKGYGADQEAWIDSALAERPNPWRIVVGHHPYVSNGIHGNAGEYEGVSGRGDDVATFFEDHVCGVADLYLSGHDHNLQWPVSPCDTELIISGGGGGHTGLEGVNPTWFEAESAGFVWIEVDSASLTAVFYDDDAVELFRDTRTRP